MMRTIVYFFICALTLSQNLLAQELERFSTGRDGRMLVVPVVIGNERYQFLVDSGASKTIVDESLKTRLQASTEQITLKLPTGFLRASLHPSPEGFVGHQKLVQVGTVGTADLTQIRSALGADIQGILGMDFLSQYSVEINFDDGVLLLWQETPNSWMGNSYEAKLGTVLGCPSLHVQLSDGSSQEFVLDTGANSNVLIDHVFDDFVASKRIVPKDFRGGVMIASGVSGTKIGLVDSLVVGNFESSWIRMDRDESSALGIWYLSRFNWCFDFKRGKVYIRPSRRFSAPEAIATCGAAILRNSGRLEIAAVEKDGPAAIAGLRAGDTITSVNGISADTIDMHDLRLLLTSKVNEKIGLQVDRSGQQFKATVVLGSKFSIPSSRSER